MKVIKIKNKAEWKVEVSGKVVGSIKMSDSSFYYQPKSTNKCGRNFDSLNECIESIMTESL